MREDMFKVIVERPRTGGSYGKKIKGRRDARAPDEESASHAPLRQHARTKWLNENLAPLKRYLHAQLGRPWDRVYGEIRERIDGRSTVQQHILEHLEDFVALDVRRVDGELVQYGMRWKPQRLSDRHRPVLYVDPRSRLLRLYTPRQPDAVPSGQTRRVIDDGTELQCLDGAWFEVRFEALAPGVVPASPPRLSVLPEAAWPRYSSAGWQHRVACAKRQLGRAELRAHGLDNGEAR